LNERSDRLRSTIEANIRQHGFHTYFVGGGPSPRWVYTIGLTAKVGVELVLAGGSMFKANEAGVIVQAIATALCDQASPIRVSQDIDVDGHGQFSLRPIDRSWSGVLLSGAHDYLQTDELDTMQIVPDEAHATIDVPFLSRPRASSFEPAWQWLDSRWNYQVASNSVAVTNLAALRGAAVTEGTRWELDQWELFAGSGPETDPSDIRFVPLGTLLANDESLVAMLSLPVGSGLWRTSRQEPWNRWVKA
jgi:hypothetical protein